MTGGLPARRRHHRPAPGTLRFSFDRRDHGRFSPGDTLASAPYSQLPLGWSARSFKYHRPPPGIFSAGPEEPNALVELRCGAAARREPNTKATHGRALRRTFRAQSQKPAGPSLRFDLRAGPPTGLLRCSSRLLLQDLHVGRPQCGKSSTSPRSGASAGLGPPQRRTPILDLYEKGLRVFATFPGDRGEVPARAIRRAGGPARARGSRHPGRRGFHAGAGPALVGGRWRSDWQCPASPGRDKLTSKLAALPNVRILPPHHRISASMTASSMAPISSASPDSSAGAGGRFTPRPSAYGSLFAR